MGTDYNSLTISAESIGRGEIFTLVIEAVPFEGTDGEGEFSTISLMANVQEATPEPTEEPTPEPTEEPTPEPTEEPTPEPTEEPTPEPVQDEELVWDEPLDAESDAEYIAAYQKKLAGWGWLIVLPEGEEYDGDMLVPVAVEGVFDQATMEATLSLQMYINELYADNTDFVPLELIDMTLEYPYVALDLLAPIMQEESKLEFLNPYVEY